MCLDSCVAPQHKITLCQILSWWEVSYLPIDNMSSIPLIFPLSSCVRARWLLSWLPGPPARRYLQGRATFIVWRLQFLKFWNADGIKHFCDGHARISIRVCTRHNKMSPCQIWSGKKLNKYHNMGCFEANITQLDCNRDIVNK